MEKQNIWQEIKNLRHCLWNEDDLLIGDKTSPPVKLCQLVYSKTSPLTVATFFSFAHLEHSPNFLALREDRRGQGSDHLFEAQLIDF